MDLSTFADICSQDDEKRTNATDVIKEAQNDPTFVKFLIDLIQSTESQENQTVFRVILQVLVNTARTHVSSFVDAMSNPEMKETLIQILFSLPLDFRPDIEECLISAAPSAETEFSEIFQEIFEKVNTESSIEDIYTVISFSNEWIKMSYPAPFFTNFSRIILPYLQACAEDDKSEELRNKTILELSELSKTLIVRGNIIFDDSFDTIFNIFSNIISQPLETETAFAMKTSISNLFSKVIWSVFHQWQSISDMDEWRQNFINTVIPEIFQHSLQACQQPMDQNLIYSLFHLFYFFILFEIMPDQILTPDFFKGVVIPCARLGSSDIIDYEINPLQYITFCCEHEDVGFFLPRICASQFLKVVMTKYNSFVDPLPLLLPEEDINPNDQLSLLDFEARIYLLERYSMCEEVPPDLFENYFNLLTQEQPLYIVSALLRFVSIPMSKSDNSIVAITVAEHFIINSTDLIVQTMAVRLMNHCLSEIEEGKLEALNGIIELNTAELFPVLLNLSSVLHIPDPMILIQKIYKIGPQDYMSVVEELVAHFFALWRENEAAIEALNDGEGNDDDADIPIDEDGESQDLVVTNQAIMNSDLMESLTTVLESVPRDSPLIQSLAGQVLEQLGSDITYFPNNSSITDQIRVAAVFSRKLSEPIEEQIAFISLIVQMDMYPPLIAKSFVNLICPLMTNSSKDFDFYKFDFNEYLVAFCQSLLSIEEDDEKPDAESISQFFVLASCMIQTKGEEFFPFISSACQILKHESLMKKSIIVFGAIYIFASALFIDADKAKALFEEDLPDFICEAIPICCTNGAYREIKMTVFLLTMFAKFGHQRSFNIAASMFKQLFDMKLLDEQYDLSLDNLYERENMHREEELVSLSPLIPMPFDSFDELNFFMEFSTESGLIGSIPGGIEGLLSPEE